MAINFAQECSFKCVIIAILTFNQKSKYSNRTAPMPTWKRMANVACSALVGKFFKVHP